MNFKVGDEVLIKAEVKDDDGHGKKQIKIKGIDGYSHLWIDVYELIPAIKTYEQGLADAWELAKKVYGMDCDAIEEIFGVSGGFYELIRDYSYEEALAKIEAYENDKKIKVGDVVEHNGFKGVVVHILPDGELNIVYENGLFGASCSAKEYVKTGKHLEVADLLRQIGE